MMILASKSPRRREILTKMGYEFEIATADTDETLPAAIPPEEGVKLLAVRKGEAVLARFSPDDFVVSSDTLVELNGTPLGKPKDAEDACRMLRSLSGKTHFVRTGVAVHHGGKCYAATASAVVTFRALTDREIKKYVAGGEPMDKAGAYGIQGAGGKFVAKLDGDFDTVMGLSSALTKKLLGQAEDSDKALRIVTALEGYYPDAACALEYHGDPWKLLVMARLSAQCTDARVNEVCKELFTVFPDCKAMATGELEKIEELVKPCGLYRMKAESIRDASALIAEGGGKIPDTMEGLLALPGVGRKIANLMLGDVFGKPAVVCDTHMMRICGRLGFYEEGFRDPEKIERLMLPILPPDKSSDFCHRVVMLGREVCTARAPACARCPLREICTHAKGADE